MCQGKLNICAMPRCSNSVPGGLFDVQICLHGLIIGRCPECQTTIIQRMKTAGLICTICQSATKGEDADKMKEKAKEERDKRKAEKFLKEKGIMKNRLINNLLRPALPRRRHGMASTGGTAIGRTMGVPQAKTVHMKRVQTTSKPVTKAMPIKATTMVRQASREDVD
ncbi:hypothetical protein EK21DRAFT_91276 [Setomelanomma holmii]|uniref:Uncharacterized protein n=1 Tax=Setomelanomma holmii TaxID=210430 RepID=A0A9P4LIB0_9PLEO|nr:hypothetical protein EK21DRAFT_91276 [Setomelanomma holmii]